MQKKSNPSFCLHVCTGMNGKVEMALSNPIISLWAFYTVQVDHAFSIYICLKQIHSLFIDCPVILGFFFVSIILFSSDAFLLS